MKTDYLFIAIKNLRSRPLRSWLTILGIIIGVFLIVTLLSLPEGIKQAVMQQLRMMGSDIVMVVPGKLDNPMIMFAGGLKLSDEDLEAIRRSQGVELVVPQLWRAKTVRFRNKSKLVFVYGVPFDKKSKTILKERMGFQTRKGRLPNNGAKEVVLGSLVAEQIFPEIKVGDTLRIAGQKLKVVGIMNSLGNKNDDSMIGIDLEIYRQITGERKGAQFAFVAIKKNFSQNEVAQNIKENLKRTRKKVQTSQEQTFSVITSEKAQSIVGNIMNIIQSAVFAIAFFAILVGAIGVMNTMFTAVNERVKEIGIMKAIGARKSDILVIFLAESGIMALLGGTIGTILGIGGAKSVELFAQFHPTFYIKAFVSPLFVFLVLMGTFLIGCLFGYLPAKRAAQLNPVEALRYE